MTRLLTTVLISIMLALSVLPSSRQTAAAASEPAFLFPWDQKDNPRYYTGGPHPFNSNDPKSAIDFGGQWPVLAIETGTVAFMGTVYDREAFKPDPKDKTKNISSGSWSGNVVVITHSNGFQSEYWHLGNIDTNLKIGSSIPRGYPIGQSGCTGDGAKDPFGDKGGTCINHLHLEFRRGGTRDKNGNWQRGAALDVTTIVIDGWSIQAATSGGRDNKGAYDGTMSKSGESIRTADQSFCGETSAGCFRDKRGNTCKEGTQDCGKIRNDLTSHNTTSPKLNTGELPPTDPPAPPSPSGSDMSTITIDYFALGDSIASGHGLSDTGGLCRRSRYAYPYDVYRNLKKQFPSVNFPPNHHLACSGATTKSDSAAIKQEPNKSLHNQVDYVLQHLQPDHPTLVTITIGANDFGWSNPSNILDLLEKEDTDYYAWVDKTVASIKESVRKEVKNLLDRPNVAVIITDYYNPFNKSSVFFNASLVLRQNLRCAFGGCYPRTGYAIAHLNLELTTIWRDLNQPERLQIAGIDAALQDHEAPRSLCGLDPPDANNTWIQYPNDPQSNSFPEGVPQPLVLANGGAWRGDCFHPREAGAESIAKAVNDDALRVLPAILRGTLDSFLIGLPDFPILKPGEQKEVAIELQNTGQMQWSKEGRFTLINTNKQPLGPTSSLRLSETIPSGIPAKLLLTVTAPTQPGPYDSVWQMAYNGLPFGEKIHIVVVVVPAGSDASLIQMIQAMIDDAKSKINEKFEAAWEDLKRKIEERIKEEIQREVQRQLRALCGTAPAALVLAGGIAWWRRRRRETHHDHV